MKVKTTLLRLIAAMTLAVPGVARAETIYGDGFTAPDGTSLVSRAPETNNGVAGATYAQHNGAWEKDIQSNQARIGADTGVSLSLDTSGSYVKPTKIRVSASMFINTINGPTTPSDTGMQRGIGLGFYSSAGGVATANDWRGLLLGTDGRLILGQHGVGGSSRAGFLAEIATGVSTAVPHTVSYQIDTTTGDVSNILLDGAPQTDVTTTVFNTATSRVGFFGSAPTGGTTARFDDFLVESVTGPAQSVTDLYNTGVDNFGVALTGGTPIVPVNDPHYDVIEVAGTPVAPFDAFLAEADGFPIGPWAANDADSRWIDPNGAEDSSAAGGRYVYRTTFTLPANADLAAVLVSGDWGSDNPTASDILINTTSTGQANGGFGGLTSFSITSGFVTGSNTLDFVFNNDAGGPTGVRVDNIQGLFRLIPEPSALLLAVMGLVGLLGFGWRWRFRT